MLHECYYGVTSPQMTSAVWPSYHRLSQQVAVKCSWCAQCGCPEWLPAAAVVDGRCLVRAVAWARLVRSSLRTTESAPTGNHDNAACMSMLMLGGACVRGVGGAVLKPHPPYLREHQGRSKMRTNTHSVSYDTMVLSHDTVVQASDNVIMCTPALPNQHTQPHMLLLCRLVGSTGAPLVAQQLMRLRLSAVWAVMVAFKGSVQPPGGLEGAFVRGSTVLSWAANNSAKLQQSAHADPHGLQCWTLISTNSYGQANKVPQEKVPPAVADKVAADMLSAFAEVLGLPGPTALPPVAFSRCVYICIIHEHHS